MVTKIGACNTIYRLPDGNTDNPDNTDNSQEHSIPDNANKLIVVLLAVFIYSCSRLTNNPDNPGNLGNAN